VNPFAVYFDWQEGQLIFISDVLIDWLKDQFTDLCEVTRMMKTTIPL
jgi:hypothetical protein